mmetsp:Transcript_5148/g.14522  ORF Transcript_5148/g.14522 Transcript_5148/m.14522 type:complete len:563 (-) Transcript_5148:46-1734(-)
MGVRLRRQSGAALRLRLRSSFWTSITIGSLLSVVAVAIVLLAPDGISADSSLGVGAVHRRLEEDLYPDDPILTKPYKDDPHRWLVILHCIGIAYMLLGLNTVCDVYFTGAIEVGVEEYEIKPDIAGATFMAAGGSAPELFTSLIGATVAVNDVGFSTIVGSAVFNVLFVIGMCGYVAPGRVELTWWPLFRDCSYYAFGLGLLATFASNEQIAFHEAAILFCAYILYCVVMWFSETLEDVIKVAAREVRKGNYSISKINQIRRNQVAPEEKYATQKAVGQTSGASLQITGNKIGKTGNYDKFEDEKPVEPNNIQTDPEQTPEAPAALVAEGGDQEGKEADDAATDAEEKSKKSEEADEDTLMTIPEGGLQKVIWCLSLPVYVPIYLGIPKAGKKWFWLTFLISLVYIAGFSFLLVWWVEILGEILHIPTVLMGFTLLAAGTSIPDAVSSMAVARSGEGDMAVSSSIGSNIFDILVGLPVPWMIKIALVDQNIANQVGIRSPYLTFYVLLLLFMVVCTVLSIHFMGWVLNKKLGLCMALLYFIFLITAASVETWEPSWLVLGAR